LEERLDRLVNLDIGGRGSEQLYAAAREIVGKPLALAAARQLAVVRPGEVVLITTGFPALSWVSPRIGENDGPAGAAVVARALQRGFGAIPVVVVEDALRPGIAAVLQAGGFVLGSLQEARRAVEREPRGAVAVVLPYPEDEAEASASADPLMDRLRPRAAVAVERPGRNRAGAYHDMRGQCLATAPAPVDLLFERAMERGIPVVAVGDGGNEIGMGLVLDAVREHVPYGRVCRCGCGGGIGARTKADVLVTAAVSNWGCYAVAACLAMLKGDTRLLHTPEMERRLLEAGVSAGLINGVSVEVDPGVDGIPWEANVAMVQLMYTMAVKAIESQVQPPRRALATGTTTP